MMVKSCHEVSYASVKEIVIAEEHKKILVVDEKHRSEMIKALFLVKNT